MNTTPREKSATIVVSREKRWAGRFTKEYIYVDNVEVGTIGAGETVSVPTEPGLRTLQMRADLCSSEPFQFNIGVGETIRFRSRPFFTGWRMLLAEWLWFLNRRSIVLICETDDGPSS